MKVYFSEDGEFESLRSKLELEQDKERLQSLVSKLEVEPDEDTENEFRLLLQKLEVDGEQELKNFRDITALEVDIPAALKNFTDFLKRGKQVKDVSDPEGKKEVQVKITKELLEDCKKELESMKNIDEDVILESRILLGGGSQSHYQNSLESLFNLKQIIE